MLKIYFVKKESISFKVILRGEQQKLLPFVSTFSRARSHPHARLALQLCEMSYSSVTMSYKVLSVMLVAFCQKSSTLKQLKQIDKCAVKTNLDKTTLFLTELNLTSSFWSPVLCSGKVKLKCNERIKKIRKVHSETCHFPYSDQRFVKFIKFMIQIYI